jgi:hypothetical protein
MKWRTILAASLLVAVGIAWASFSKRPTQRSGVFSFAVRKDKVAVFADLTTSHYPRRLGTLLTGELGPIVLDSEDRAVAAFTFRDGQFHLMWRWSLPAHFGSVIAMTMDGSRAWVVCVSPSAGKLGAPAPAIGGTVRRACVAADRIVVRDVYTGCYSNVYVSKSTDIYVRSGTELMCLPVSGDDWVRTGVASDIIEMADASGPNEHVLMRSYVPSVLAVYDRSRREVMLLGPWPQSDRPKWPRRSVPSDCRMAVSVVGDASAPCVLYEYAGTNSQPLVGYTNKAMLDVVTGETVKFRSLYGGDSTQVMESCGRRSLVSESGTGGGRGLALTLPFSVMDFSTRSVQVAVLKIPAPSRVIGVVEEMPPIPLPE